MLLVVEHKRKSVRPIYPVVCLQIQSLIWCGIRLQTSDKFKDEFRTLSIETRIIYIWITQLFSVVFALLLHLFLKKCLQKINQIHLLYENSSSKIMLLCFVVDLRLIELLLHKCGTKIIQCLKDGLEPNILWLNNTSKKSISIIIIKVFLLFCILGCCLFGLSTLYIGILIFMLVIIYVFYTLFLVCILPVLFAVEIALIVCVIVSVFTLNEDISDLTLAAENLANLNFAAIDSAYFQYVNIQSWLSTFKISGILFIIFMFFSLFAILLLRFTQLPFSKLKWKSVRKSLYRQSKNLFFFLIVFVPYYVIISAALYLLVFILHFSATKAFHF